MIIDYLKLSKEVSYALRHAPWKYELELDVNGWVNISQLLESLQSTNEWIELTKKDLQSMIEQSDKKRHEIVNDKIRALYGHSLPQRIIKEIKQPPQTLFHGTARKNISSIKDNGLHPKGRQYVHLSNDKETALEVGKRRDGQPVILTINALQAWEEGTKFYYGNEKVWLADHIHSKHILF